MNTKLMIAATVAALSLATAAFAEGEGGRQPLPFTTSFDATAPASVLSNSQDYPWTGSATQVTTLNNQSLPSYGAQGEVASANSLPVGALNGTVQYAQAQSANRWFAQQADHRFALQQTRQARPNG